MVSIEEIECVHIKKNLVFGIQKLYTQFIKIPLLCDNLAIKLLYKLYKKSTFTSSAILHTTANHRAYGVCPKRGRSRSPTHVNSVCLFVIMSRSAGLACLWYPACKSHSIFLPKHLKSTSWGEWQLCNSLIYRRYTDFEVFHVALEGMNHW